MSEITGVIHVEDGGQRIPLRLSMRAIAELQTEFGRDCLTRMDGAGAGDFDFALAVRAIELAIGQCNRDLGKGEIAALADRVGSIELFTRLIVAAFPPPPEGDAKN